MYIRICLICFVYPQRKENTLRTCYLHAMVFFIYLFVFICLIKENITIVFLSFHVNCKYY